MAFIFNGIFYNTCSFSKQNSGRIEWTNHTEFSKNHGTCIKILCRLPHSLVLTESNYSNFGNENYTSQAINQQNSGASHYLKSDEYQIHMAENSN